MERGRGEPMTSETLSSKSSGIRLRPTLWESATTTSVAPPSKAPFTAALTSSVIIVLAQAYSRPPGEDCSWRTTHPIPSMSADM